MTGDSYWRRPTRRILALVPEGRAWDELSETEQLALFLLERHIRFRVEQKQFEPLEVVDGQRAGIFLTVSHVQRLLKELRYWKKGEKFAAEIINTLLALGAIEDTNRVKKPRRSEQDIAAAEKFQSRAEFQGDIATEGGKDAQPSLLTSHWWRIFRVPALAAILHSLRPLGAYSSGQLRTVPQKSACLSALLKSQGLIPKRKRRSRPNPGSVQWSFQHSGPP
jgi:hypothetical protein